jgi:hypothetical protein
MNRSVKIRKTEQGLEIALVLTLRVRTHVGTLGVPSFFSVEARRDAERRHSCVPTRGVGTRASLSFTEPRRGETRNGRQHRRSKELAEAPSFAYTVTSTSLDTLPKKFASPL